MKAFVLLAATTIFLPIRLPAIAETSQGFEQYVLDFSTPTTPALQTKIEAIDTNLRDKHGITSEVTSVGVLDLKNLQLAMIHPDRIEYAAGLPMAGILLAYFQFHPEAVTNLDSSTRNELGLMAKGANNELAAKFSREIGLLPIQEVLDSYQLYDKNHGGGIWIGKHFGAGTERFGDPVANHSHAATVRQLLRFYLLLEQGKLVSPQASKAMREVMASPDIPHVEVKFVKGLAGRDLQMIRTRGGWKEWNHDSVVVTGPGHHYILVGLTRHLKGDFYLVDLAKAVDDLIIKEDPKKAPATTSP